MYAAFIYFNNVLTFCINEIWYKWIEMGVSLKIVKMFRSMFTCVKSCVRANGRLSNYFDSFIGLKQGEPLTPLFLYFSSMMLQ
jgi:hypothetical protein